MYRLWTDCFVSGHNVKKSNHEPDIVIFLIQTEAERRRREAGVKQSMELRVRSCMYVCGYVGMYGIWNYLANQGT